jgi:hypothetical protein
LLSSTYTKKLTYSDFVRLIRITFHDHNATVTAKRTLEHASSCNLTNNSAGDPVDLLTEEHDQYLLDIWDIDPELMLDTSRTSPLGDDNQESNHDPFGIDTYIDTRDPNPTFVILPELNPRIPLFGATDGNKTCGTHARGGDLSNPDQNPNSKLVWTDTGTLPGVKPGDESVESKRREVDAGVTGGERNYMK